MSAVGRWMAVFAPVTPHAKTCSR